MGFNEVLHYPTAQEGPNEYEFTEEELAEIERHKAKYPDVKSAVMPALWIAQEKYGWLPQKVIKLVADTLGLSYAQVYGVATFYTMYLKENKGKNLVEVCTCFTCGECGGDELIAYIKEKVNANEEGVSADGEFYVRTAECLGACDSAPVVQVNNRRICFDVDEKYADEILELLRQGKEVPYKPVPLADQSAIG